MSDSEKSTILLVDDRPENLLALEAVLSPLEQNLISATSGEEALRCLLEQEVALIILDVQMPGLDGFETATQIKEREKTRDIPIIFITAISQEPYHALRGYSTGAVDYLFKPFDPWALRTKAGVFIDLYFKDKTIERQGRLLNESLHGPIKTLTESMHELSAGAIDDEARQALGRASEAVAALNQLSRELSE